MKNLKFVILGIFLGLVVSGGLVALDRGEEKTAYSEDIYGCALAKVASLGWEDIFGGDAPENVYCFLVDDLTDDPEDDAYLDVGKMYGLTTQEVKAVVDGSIIPIYNNPDRKNITMSQDAAFSMAQEIREDFEDLKDLYLLQKEIEASVVPGEIFSNGDVSDSGFDLIYDLTVIEEILFLDTSTNEIGKPFDVNEDSSKKKNLKRSDDSPPNKNPLAVLDSNLSVEYDDEGNVEDAKLKIGDKEMDVEFHEEDICPDEEDDFTKAMESYDKEQEEKQAVEEPDSSEPDGGAGEGSPSSGVEDAEEPGVKPPPADDWAKAFCPGAPKSTGAGSFNTFGDSASGSLGGVVNSVIGQAIGTAAAYNEGGLGAWIYLCLETNYVKKTYKTFQPGNSCILCEIEQINDFMDETLNHSLVPNKATGNIMESAKCKDTGSLLNIQFVSIAAPIPSPPNDDIILGNNIFEEWNKFINRYQPFLGFSPTRDISAEVELEFMPQDTTQEDILLSTKAVTLQKKADALNEIENYTKANYGKNVALYVQTILGELDLMNAFFENYKEQYGDIVKLFDYFRQLEQK